jgi:hypothetical protein
MMPKATCEHRIDHQLEDRIVELRSLMERVNEDDEEAYEEMNTMVLGSFVRKIVTLTLSWGGPADYLDFHLDPHGNLLRVVYRFEDWYDGASRTLSGTELSVMTDMFEEQVRWIAEHAE